MAKPEEGIGICLHQLVAREEAVIKRVIAFSSSQGRNYYTADMLAAQIVIVSDNQLVDFSDMNPEGSMIVRIGGQECAEPYDVLMMRPLLVTRVMRTLDDACALLREAVLASEPETHSGSEPEQAANGDAIASESVDDDVTTSVVEQTAAVSEAETVDKSVSTDSTPELAAEEDIDLPDVSAVAVESKESKAEPVVDAMVQEASAKADKSVQLAATVAIEQPESEARPVAENEVEDESDGGTEYQHCALVVDDSAAIRKQLELELRDAGIRADFAEDGEQALEKVSANHYDLIFLDIIMPGIDGYETCRQMRSRTELKKTPIIMLSAKTSPLDEVQGVIAGASTYLTKPVKSEQLQSTLKRVSMWIDNFQVA